MGLPGRFPIGPYLLAHMLSCPVYFVAGLYSAPNRYDLFFEPFAESVKLPRASRQEAAREYAQKYATVLESLGPRPRGDDSWVVNREQRDPLAHKSVISLLSIFTV